MKIKTINLFILMIMVLTGIMPLSLFSQSDNLLINPGFEQGDITDWIADGSSYGVDSNDVYFKGLL